MAAIVVVVIALVATSWWVFIAPRFDTDPPLTERSAPSQPWGGAGSQHQGSSPGTSGSALLMGHTNPGQRSEPAPRDTTNGAGLTPLTSRTTLGTNGATMMDREPVAKGYGQQGRVEDRLEATPGGGNATPIRQPVSITLHIVGAVHRPGVVHIRSGARLYEAIALVGGMTPDADPRSVNLAQIVQDGQQVIVQYHGDPLIPALGPMAPNPPAPGVGTGGNLGGAPTTVNLNTATVGELEQLPGIGPKTAQAIVTYREEHGPFTSVDHLEAVPGIGPKTIAALREVVTP